MVESTTRLSFTKMGVDNTSDVTIDESAHDMSFVAAMANSQKVCFLV